MNALLNLFKQNPSLYYLLAYVVLTVIVGVTPQKYQKTPFFGLILTVMHRLSVLTHADQPGTFQIPLILKVLGISLPPTAVAVLTGAEPAPQQAPPADPPAGGSAA
jgi:hypothetical protein